MTDGTQMIEELLQSILEETRRTYAILVEIRSLLEQQTNQPSTTTDGKPSHLGNNKVSSEAVAFCLEHDWLFKKAGNGQYPRRVANLAAAAFLSKHGLDDRRRFSEMLRHSRSSLEGRVRVYDGVFDNLWHDFVLNQGQR